MKPMKPGGREWSNPHIDAFGARLSRLSDDITNLERYLTASPVRVFVRVGGDDLSICWGREGGKVDLWRVLLNGERPLIEAPTADRLAAEPLLEKLLTAVGDACAHDTTDTKETT